MGWGVEGRLLWRSGDGDRRVGCTRSVAAESEWSLHRGGRVGGGCTQHRCRRECVVLQRGERREECGISQGAQRETAEASVHAESVNPIVSNINAGEAG